MSEDTPQAGAPEATQADRQPPDRRPPNNLTSSQRKTLRGMAHNLKPVVHIGRAGLSSAVLQEIDHSLEQHELIKIRFLDFKDERKALCREISIELGCDQAGLVGHVAIFFRPARDPERRRIDVRRL